MRKLIIAVVVACATVVGAGSMATPAVLASATPPVPPAPPASRIVVVPAAPSAAVQAASVDSGSTAAQSTPFPLSHLAVQWHGASDAVVEVRWSTGDGWQPWQVVATDHDMTEGGDGTVYSGLMRADGAVRVEARAAAGDVRDLQLVLIDATGAGRVAAAGTADSATAQSTTGTTFETTSAMTAATTTSTTSSTSSTSSTIPGTTSITTSTTTAPGEATPAVREPPVITRAQWGADESMRKGTPEFAPITKLIVHHTDTPNNDPDPASTVRAIYAYHTQDQGWNDIGYNFLIDEAGHVYEGRYARTYAKGEVPTGEDVNENGVIGAHALNANTGSVGVALLGTFDSQAPTDAAIASLEDLLAWEADRHAIDPAGATPYRMGDGTTKSFGNISGHRDTYQTACPGDVTYSMLPSIRQAVSNRVSAAHGATKGYWVTGRNGEVYPFGGAGQYGSMAGRGLNSPMVGMAATPTGKGYWLLGSDGGIFAFGDAAFFGSTGGIKLNKPVVALEPTPTGKGYWLVASDGGIFAYGDAAFFGSTGGIRLNKPVVGMAATGTGKGYWLVASDGGIFAYGDATFHGSTGSIKLNSPVVAMAGGRAPGAGYWMVAGDGGIFAYDVAYRGSVPGLKLKSYAGSVDMQPTADGLGYYVLGADGGIFNFGDANFLGAHSGLSGTSAAAAMAVMPT